MRHDMMQGPGSTGNAGAEGMLTTSGESKQQTIPGLLKENDWGVMAPQPYEKYQKVVAT
jgi:hypothetical protein